MPIRLKPLHQQVIFITGATSGIGLSTVHRAVEQGAKVFMTARNEDDLQKLQDEMRHKGYETAYAVCDVAEIDQLQFAVDQCLNTFGRIDTFINNAGISIYGKLMETTIDEARRLFDTNFWGVVNGCKVAVPVMRESGGSIINIGSVLSEVALPIQGVYSASKHAVKAFTDTLRRELMAEKAPIQITLVMPGAIDTPYPEHARSHIGEPVHTPPVYSPEVVAKVILRCAERPTREIGVGASSYLFPFIERFFPNLQDKIMSKAYMENAQSNNRQHLPREHGDAGNLNLIPHKEGSEDGHYPGHVMKSSLATEVAERKGLIKGGAVAAGLAWLFMKRMRIF
ncbi:MAG: SDR family oxidoreductase [Bacteriovoracia bacterium]